MHYFERFRIKEVLLPIVPEFSQEFWNTNSKTCQWLMTVLRAETGKKQPRCDTMQVGFLQFLSQNSSLNLDSSHLKFPQIEDLSSFRTQKLSTLSHCFESFRIKAVLLPLEPDFKHGFQNKNYQNQSYLLQPQLHKLSWAVAHYLEIPESVQNVLTFLVNLIFKYYTTRT